MPLALNSASPSALAPWPRPRHLPSAFTLVLPHPMPQHRHLPFNNPSLAPGLALGLDIAPDLGQPIPWPWPGTSARNKPPISAFALGLTHSPLAFTPSTSPSALAPAQALILDPRPLASALALEPQSRPSPPALDLDPLPRARTSPLAWSLTRSALTSAPSSSPPFTLALVAFGPDPQPSPSALGPQPWTQPLSLLDSRLSPSSHALLALNHRLWPRPRHRPRPYPRPCPRPRPRSRPRPRPGLALGLAIGFDFGLAL
jgi:hypothetical protein